MRIFRQFWSRSPLLSLALCLSCGVPGVPKPPSLELPRPVTNLKAIRKGDVVYLTWTAPTETTDSLPIHHEGSTVVCRSVGTMRPGCAGGVLPALWWQQPSGHGKFPHLQDALPADALANDPAVQVFYAITVFNEHTRDAGISNVVSVPAVVPGPPPADFRAAVTAEGVVLAWATPAGMPETRGVSHVYRVYRREEKSEQDAVVGEVPTNADTLTLIDHGFEWEKTYLYRATVVNQIHVEEQTEAQFEGEDTPPVRVFAHDVFPPAVPSDLQAVFSGAGQQSFIDLIWPPDTDADLAGYNVYRHENGDQPTKISTELIKTPAFRDTNVSAGHTYFYSVSAVDVRGNESAKSAEASESVPR